MCYDSALNVTAFVMIFLFVPETKQRTLEELDYVCTYRLSLIPIPLRQGHSHLTRTLDSRGSYSHPYGLSSEEGASILVQTLRLHGQNRNAGTLIPLRSAGGKEIRGEVLKYPFVDS